MQYCIAFIYGAALVSLYHFFPVTSTILSGLFLFHLFCAGKRKLLPLIAVILITFLGFCSAWLRAVPPPPLSVLAGQTIHIKGTVRTEPVPLSSPPSSPPGGFSQTIDLSEAFDNNGNRLDLREIRVISTDAMAAGMPYSVTVHIPQDAYSMNPGSVPVISGTAIETAPVDDPSGPLWKRSVRFFRMSRARLNAAMKNALSPRSAPFILSLITGERGLLSKETNHAFNVTGLGHMLNVAGLHFGLLFFFLFQATNFFIRHLPHKMLSRLTLYAAPSQIAALISFPFMVWYLGISLPNFRTLRAFIMICFFLFGLLLQRKRYWLNTLLLAAFIIVLYQPDSLLDLSFQLSFLSVLCIGIAVGSPRKASNFPETPPRSRLRAFLLEHTRSSLLITFAANVGTAPLIIYYFHNFSLISLPANLIFIPIIGFIILPMAFLSSLFFFVFNSFPFITVLDTIAGHVLSLVHYIGQWEFAAIRVPAFPRALLVFFYAGLGIFTALLHRKGEKRLLLFPCAVAIVPIIIFSINVLLEKSKLSATFLDVGQGDGAVIELPDHQTLIMDTGKNGSQVGDFLRYQGINEIEAIMLSHGHHDHTGGLGYLINAFKVHAIWDNGRLEYPAGLIGKIEHRRLQRGDIINGKGYTIMVLHPYEGFYSSGGKNSEENSEENNDSLVLKVRGTAASFLFTGDIEQEGEEDVAHASSLLKSTVLKVAHHGSRSSSPEAFINAVSPEIAVISSGRKNRFHHPHPETLAVLAHSRIFRTDRDGAIRIIEENGGKLTVKTWKDFQLAEIRGWGDEWLNIRKLFWVW